MKKTVAILCLVMALTVLAPATVLAQAEFDIKIFPSKLELSGNPGTTQDFVINVQNQGSEDQVMKVYFNDYFIKPNNEFVFREPGHYSYSCAKWMSTENKTVSIKAGTTEKQALKLSVPLNAEPGGHYGVIFFEQIPPQGDSPVLAQGRIGVTALVTVPGEIVRKGEIESVSVTGSWFWPSRKVLAGPRKVTRARVVFKNEGNVHLTVKGKITYTPSFGWGTGSVDLQEITVLPKTTRYLDATLPDPPVFGSYNVRAEVSYGPSLEVFDTTVTKEGTFHEYPFFWLVVILVIAALIVGAVILLKLARRGRKGEKEGPSSESPDDSGGKGRKKRIKKDEADVAPGKPGENVFELLDPDKMFEEDD